MIRAGFRLLVLLGVLLVAALGVEASFPPPGSDDPALMTGIRAAPRLPRMDSVPAVAQAIDHTDAWVATILARPLFSRDRRPADAHVASTSVDTTLPRLTGIAVGPLGRSAIFAGSSGGKPIVVSEGGSVGPYTIRAIGPDGVQVEGPGGKRTVAPAFDPTSRVKPDVDATQQPLQQMPQPGFMQPGMPRLPLGQGSPLMLQPGAMQPGQIQPGQMQPGQMQPGQMQPGGPLGMPGRAPVGDGASLVPGRFARDLFESATA